MALLLHFLQNSYRGMTQNIHIYLQNLVHMHCLAEAMFYARSEYFGSLESPVLSIPVSYAQ